MSNDFGKWFGAEAMGRTRQKWLPWAIGGVLAIQTLIAALEMFDDGIEEDWLPNITTWLLSFAVIVSASPFTGEASMFASDGRKLDEFERQAVARGTGRAYVTLVSLVLALFAWCWIASVQGWPVPRTPLDWSSWGMVFFAGAFGLPIMFAEMAVPLPPEGEEAEQGRD